MLVRIGEVWLAGQPGVAEHVHSSTDGLQMVPRRVTQQIEGWRWPHAQFLDRANWAWQVDFDTRRVFSSYPDCFEWMRGFETFQGWAGTVTFHQPIGDGTFAEFDLEEAVIVPPPLSPVGVSLTLHYSILGREFSQSRVGAYGSLLTEGGDTILTEGGDFITL